MNKPKSDYVSIEQAIDFLSFIQKDEKAFDGKEYQRKKVSSPVKFTKNSPKKPPKEIKIDANE